jgi:hypothetical protein
MKRDIYEKLLTWKSSRRRKPLLLQGARQTGKTFILKEFGRNEYESVVYCNFEEDPGLDQFFHRDLNPKRILADISIYADRTIRTHGKARGGRIASYLTDEQRSQAGWLGASKCEVVFERALKLEGHKDVKL